LWNILGMGLINRSIEIGLNTSHSRAPHKAIKMPNYCGNHVSCASHNGAKIKNKCDNYHLIVARET